MFLGLDLSLSSTGVCLLLDSQAYKTTAIKTTAQVKGVKRLQAILTGIEEFIGGRDDHGVTMAAIEGYAYKGTGTVFQLAELGGLVRYHLLLWGIPFIVPTTNYVKQFATGYGSADKVQIGEALRAAWGVDFLRTDWPGHKKDKPMPPGWGNSDAHWRNDEADAYVLSNIAAFYEGVWDRTPTPEQLHVLEGVKLDPEGVLTRAAKERMAERDAKGAR